MGNGVGPLALINVAARWHKFAGESAARTIRVAEAWSDHDDVVAELSIGDGSGGTVVRSLLDAMEARQLAALLLQTAGLAEVAQAIPGALGQIEERERIREAAYTAMREATRAAERTFVAATTPQQEAYNAAMAQAEQAFAEATGEPVSTGRTVSLSTDPASAPF